MRDAHGNLALSANGWKWHDRWMWFWKILAFIIVFALLSIALIAIWAALDNNSILQFIFFVAVAYGIGVLYQKWQNHKKSVALRKRMDAIRDALYRDAHCDLGDDDKYILEIIQSGRENEYLHPTWLAKEENEKLIRLGAATSDMSLTEMQREQARKEYHELINELFVQGKIRF